MQVLKTKWPMLIKYFWLVAVLVLGIGPIVHPYLSGISDVCCPDIYRRFLFDLLLFWAILGAIAVLVQGVLVVIFVKRNGFNSFAKYALLVLTVLVISTGLSYRQGIYSYGDKRVSAFPWGARVRLYRAGGSDQLRKEVVDILNSPMIDIPPEKWPHAIQDLGATHVDINREQETVNIVVKLARVFFPTDDFGFLFQKVETSHLDEEYFFSNSNGYRIWMLEDGVFFYQKW